MNFNFLHLVILVFLVFPVSSEEIFFNNHNIHGEDSTFKDFIKWQLSGNKPDRFSIEMSDEFNLLLKKPKTPYAVWVGHSNFLINNNDINILTDPIFSKRASPISFAGPKRLIPPGINFNLLPDIDVVTVSHAHYDHMDIPTLKRLYEINKNTLFLVPMNSAKLLLSAGIKNVVEMNWWDTISLSDTLITFVPVHHWSSRTPFDKNETLWGGWWFEHSSLKLVHLGDTGYTYDFLTINKELGSPDFAFIPIGAYEPRSIMKDSHLNPDEAIQTALDLNATHAIGMHWGTFMLTDEPVQEPPVLVKNRLKELDLEGLFTIPIPGKIISLE